MLIMKNGGITTPRYGLSILLLLAGTLLSGCFSPVQLVVRDEPKVDGKRLHVVGIALAQLGTPYVYGGTTPGKGFDCSGLVQYSHNDAGIHVPRTAAEQFSHANKKPVDQLLPGDLIFFKTEKNSDHVGIYLGNGEFIHAPSTGKNVKLSSIHRPYWQRRFLGVGSYL